MGTDSSSDDSDDFAPDQPPTAPTVTNDDGEFDLVGCVQTLFFQRNYFDVSSLGADEPLIYNLIPEQLLAFSHPLSLQSVHASNKHLHRINRSDTSNCPNCTDIEEIGQCPAYSRVRGDTLGTYYDSINDIMDNNNIDLVINFALKTKRLRKKEDKDDTGVT